MAQRPAVNGERISAPRFTWIAALAITAVAVALHVIFFTHAGGLWRDEINLLNLSKLSSLSGMADDSFPVLMPLLVKAWLAVGMGGTDLGLRFLGVIIGLALIGSLWIAVWVTRRQPPLLGLALLGLNPIVIFYGDALRAYGLGSLLIVLALAAMWRVIEQPTALRTALAAGLVVLSVQTLFHNTVLVGAICVGAWAACLRRKDWHTASQVLVVAAVGVISLLPYLSKYAALRDSAEGFRIGFRPLPAWLRFLEATDFMNKNYQYFWLVFGLIALVAGGVALVGRSKVPMGLRLGNDRELAVFLAVTLMVSIAAYTGFLWFTAITPQAWYFLPWMSVAVICFDAAGQRLNRYLDTAFLGFALGTALIAFPVARIKLMCRYTNVDVIAGKLTADATPDDLIVLTYWWAGITFEHYFKGQTPWSTLPPMADHRFSRIDLVKSQLGRPGAIQPVLDQIRATLQAGHRVWLVGYFDIPAKEAPTPPDLPAPPLPVTGWSDSPYLSNWTDQTTHLLKTHSIQFEKLSLPGLGDVYHNENLNLGVASGWTLGTNVIP